MKITDTLEEIYFALIANKVRSGLTVLGIIIGIGSVIALVGVGQGTQNTIQSSIQSLGSNLILVTPGSQRGVGMQVSQGRGSAQSLTKDDATAIATEVASVSAVAPELSGRYQVTAKGTNTNTSVLGTTESYLEVRNVQISEGVFVSAQNETNRSRVAVLGPSVRDDLFGEDASAVGQTIKIKGNEFKVIGITEEKGGSGFNNQDDMIFVPLSTAQQFLSGSNYVSTIGVQAANQDVMAQVQSDISSLLLSRHNISDATLADFSIMNQSDIVATATSVASTFTILLAAVASISLIVGGIGIMNMMLTTVTERTREIGLRKAIGAKRKDINLQFLGEAIALTFLGGIFGVILGGIVSFVMQKFMGVAVNISIPSVLLAFGVSALIGIIFGYYPAQRAAKLNPIESLRYE
ncbi:MAG: ABC transporter permease [Candidatus Paceibacterota bacterium]